MAHSSSIKLWSFYTDDLRRVEVCKIEMSHLYWEGVEGDNVNEWCTLYLSARWSESKAHGCEYQLWDSNSGRFFQAEQGNLTRKLLDSLAENQVIIENKCKNTLISIEQN